MKKIHIEFSDERHYSQWSGIRRANTWKKQFC